MDYSREMGDLSNCRDINKLCKPLRISGFKSLRSGMPQAGSSLRPAEAQSRGREMLRGYLIIAPSEEPVEKRLLIDEFQVNPLEIADFLRADFGRIHQFD